MKAYAIIPAAGHGRRMGASQPKQYLEVGGAPVLVWAVRALASHPGIVGSVVAVSRGDEQRVRDLLGRYGVREGVQVVTGGDDRQASVAAALAYVPPCDVVLVHDGARPLVPPEVVTRVLAMASSTAVTAALPVHDTVKAVEGEVVQETLDRSRLWAIQTPQGFPYEMLVRAHAQAGAGRVTDDCALVERLGERVRVVEGSPQNIKITTPDDLPLAEMWLKQRSETGRQRRLCPGVGFGYDVHRLVAGRELILGGVRIPHAFGLLGHSDADVLLHACMDALLGAAGLGDIGQHFPENDTYAGASSLGLLRQVSEKLAAVGLRAHGLDAVVIAEKPRLAQFAPEMRGNIADALGLPLACVNVKASTNERLGFLGRQEGIAAQAVAWVD